MGHWHERLKAEAYRDEDSRAGGRHPARRSWSGAIVAVSVIAFCAAASARAQTTTKAPAAILIWPKVVVDTQGILVGTPTDTLINLSNADPTHLKQAYCKMINTVGGCSDTNAPCLSSLDCSGEECVAAASQRDFVIVITPEQPLAWFMSTGLSDLPIGGPGLCASNFAVCLSDSECPGSNCVIGPGGMNNQGTSVPPVATDPFVGSLTCVQYDPTAMPPGPDRSATPNSLIGEATIFRTQVSPSPVDSAKYNAVGLRATVSDDGGELEYARCAGALFMNHYFDGATDPIATGPVSSGNGITTTDIALAPCGDVGIAPAAGSAEARFAVYNEFEQRFEAMQVLQLPYSRKIADIDRDTTPNSIWSAGVAGTLTGHTLAEAIGAATDWKGFTGVAFLEIASPTGTTTSAYNLEQHSLVPAATPTAAPPPPPTNTPRLFDPSGRIVRGPGRRIRFTVSRPSPNDTDVRCVEALDPNSPDFDGTPFVEFANGEAEIDIELSSDAATVCCQFRDSNDDLSGLACDNITLPPRASAPAASAGAIVTMFVALLLLGVNHLTKVRMRAGCVGKGGT